MSIRICMRHIILGAVYKLRRTNDMVRKKYFLVFIIYMFSFFVGASLFFLTNVEQNNAYAATEIGEIRTNNFNPVSYARSNGLEFLEKSAASWGFLGNERYVEYLFYYKKESFSTFTEVYAKHEKGIDSVELSASVCRMTKDDYLKKFGGAITAKIAEFAISKELNVIFAKENGMDSSLTLGNSYSLECKSAIYGLQISIIRRKYLLIKVNEIKDLDKAGENEVKYKTVKKIEFYNYLLDKEVKIDGVILKGV